MSYLKAKFPITITQWTVESLIQAAVDKILDLSPAFQRGYVAREEWYRRFIGGILQKATNSAIHLRRMPDGSFQVIDGLQRITTLLNFFKSNFKTPTYHGAALPIHVNNTDLLLQPSTWQEISERSDAKLIMDLFKNFKITVVEYDVAMTDDEASEVFTNLNDNNDLNDQEKRNGILGLISEWVREVSRLGVKYNLLSMLKVLAMKSNGRMNIDEMIARSLLYECWHQTRSEGLADGIYSAYCNKQQLDDFYRGLYRNDEVLLKRWIKEVERRWKMVKMIVEASHAPEVYTKKASYVITLFQLTYALEEKFGKELRFDYPTFARNLWKEFSKLVASKNIDEKESKFSELIGQYSPSEMQEKLALIISAIGEKGITERDSVRVFDLGAKHRRWEDQGRCCAATGLPLEFADAVGGHRVAHVNGGKTVYSNLVVLSKKINAQMGATDFDVFMQRYQQRAA